MLYIVLFLLRHLFTDNYKVRFRFYIK